MTSSPDIKPARFSEDHKLCLGYYVTHPIQYQAPMLRRIAQEPDIDLRVFFSSNISVRKQGYDDQDFKVNIKWDTPLLDGYKYEFLPAVRNSNEIAFTKPINYGIRSRFKKQRIDALWVHGYSNLSNLQAMFAAKSLRIPVFLRSDSTLYDHRRCGMKLAAKNLIFKILRSKVSGALSVGEANTAYWLKYFGDDFPIFPCKYAVDNAFFQQQCRAAAGTRKEFRQSLGLEAGRTVILFAAKLIERKRCIDLLRAFMQISTAGELLPCPYLLIVGDGEERRALETQAGAAIGKDVRFLGFRNQSELPEFYDLCDVFVLPSVNEPWGLAINEAMNAGRAMIVSDQVGCQRDLVHPGVNGCVVGAGDVKALAASLRLLLSEETMRHAMGVESLRIIQGFTFEQNVAGLRQALQAFVPGFSAAPYDSVS